jgi:hypothetical protein
MTFYAPRSFEGPPVSCPSMDHPRGTVALAQPQPLPIIEPGPRQAPGPLMAPVPATEGRLRRCTFRRLTPLTAARASTGAPDYRVECLYPDRETPIPLGDLACARAICDACAATGIFRPDED